MTASIPGVERVTSPSVGDERGSFREIWRASTLDPSEHGPILPSVLPPFPAPASTPGADRAARFVQANLSSSATGVLRGLHLHRHQLDLWFVVEGRVFTALVDVRPVLAGAERPVVETFEMAADDRLTIPAGVAHGFLALEPTRLLYLVTNEYDGSDELGFAWDDPLADVHWPRIGAGAGAGADGRPILSERDRANPSLAELVVRLRDSRS